MPLKGGASDKYGNRFEGYWTVDRILDIIDEDSDTITLEPVGEGKGLEFFMRKGTDKEFHQVKRQRTEGQWTISNLKPILTNFYRKLKEKDVTCIFVSTISSAELNDLVERSGKAKNYNEFEEHFMTSKVLKSLFEHICLIWECIDPKEAYELLKRLDIETITEKRLIKNISNRIESLIIGDPKKVISVLFEYVASNIHKELDINDILNHLNTYKFYPSDFSKDSSIWGRVTQINDQYENRLDFLTEHMISRIEVEYILNNFESKDIMITGSAGLGKSTVILQTIKKLKTKKIPFLILDADNLETAHSAKELGENLNLNHSPVNVLKNISQNKNSVLIIDQLDNVSLVPSIRPEFFDCILDLIQNASLYPNMSIILSCRDFDLNSDPRLKKLLNTFNIEELKIKKLTTEQVLEYIQFLKLDPNSFNNDQIEILSIPLHLKLLSEICNESDPHKFDFKSSFDLYDLYSKTKKKKLQTRIGRPIKWNEVIDTLCKYMNTNNTFYVHEIFLDSYSTDAELMASEGVLFLNQNNYSFFHRSYFDYAFAKRFIATKKDIVGYLTSLEQHLFMRMQVNQILTYKRNIDFKDYIKDINSLLTNPSIRFHIKKAVFEFLSQLKNPEVDEWLAIHPFIINKDSKLHKTSWQTIYGSLEWFDLIDSTNFFQNKLNTTNGYLIEKIMWIFFGIFKQTDRVSVLIEPFIGLSLTWNERITNLMRWADLSQDAYFKLFLQLIDDGIFEDNPKYGENDYWDDIKYTIIHKLNETHSERSITVISHYLNRKIKLALSIDEKNPFSDNDKLIPTVSFEENDFIDMAERSPQEFVGQILPIILQLMGLNADKKSDKPYKDDIWRFKHYSSERFHSDDILLYAMEKALSKLANVNIKSFKHWESILRSSDFETAHYLLIRTYTINRSKFSHVAVEYLLKNNKSLELGYLNSSVGVSMQLIRGIAPHCNIFDLKNLENLLLNYFTDIPHFKWVFTFHTDNCEKFRLYEYRKANRQINLLNSIPSSLRSIPIRNRITELYKFNVHYEKPKKMDAFFVTSPISDETAKNFTDDDWLQTISKYDKEVDMLEGGPHELSIVLEKFTTESPTRFAKLALKFDNKTNINYFNAVLRGIANSKVSINFNDVRNFCKHCHNQPNKPCGRWITQPIANFAESKLPKDVLDIVSWYAIHDPDPTEELWKSTSSRSMVYFGGKIHDAGLNSVRGMVAHSISKMIYYNKDLIDYFLPTLKLMVKDNSIAVRSCIAKTLVMLSSHNKPLAIELFKKLIDTDDILLKTPYVAEFVYSTIRNNFDDITDVINRMIISDNLDVNEVGAKAASYSSLIMENKLPQLNYSIYISKRHRLGVAKAFSEYLTYASTPSLVIEVLSGLFSDSSEEVLNASYWSFRKINDGNIDNYIDLIRKFIYNKSSCSYRQLIYSLKDLSELPYISIEVCEQFFKLTGFKAADITKGSSGTAFHVLELILRIYSQANNEKISKRCLDLVDLCLEFDVHGAEDEIDKLMRSIQS